MTDTGYCGSIYVKKKQLKTFISFIYMLNVILNDIAYLSLSFSGFP